MGSVERMLRVDLAVQRSEKPGVCDPVRSKALQDGTRSVRKVGIRALAIVGKVRHLCTGARLARRDDVIDLVQAGVGFVVEELERRRAVQARLLLELA